MEKRVLAIHDISCVGRCSLTVALPVISSAGIEVSVLPTAILSTHTGGFEGYTFRDLTEDITPITNHWKQYNLDFDCIFTGYLGSFEQLNLVEGIFDDFGKNAKILVDPVMGDNGKMYASFTKDYAKGYCKLCNKADIITPNVTEASLLLDIPYRADNHDKPYIENMLHSLAELGPKQIVLTGVVGEDDTVGCASFDKETNKISYCFNKKIAGSFHGTGDVFSSSLVGALMNGFSLDESVAQAVKFTVDSIKHTLDSERPSMYGVDFESCIADYAAAVTKK